MGFRFLALFSDLLIAHHRSLNFRAMVLAAMIAAKNSLSNADYAVITEIASGIYGSDQRRSNALLRIVREHVSSIKNREKSLDSLLENIDRELKSVHRYANKIDFSHLRRLMMESDEEDALLQTQIYDFLLSEVKRYSE